MTQTTSSACQKFWGVADHEREAQIPDNFYEVGDLATHQN